MILSCTNVKYLLRLSTIPVLVLSYCNQYLKPINTFICVISTHFKYSQNNCKVERQE